MRRIALLLSVSATFLVAAGCASTLATMETDAAKALISDDQESQIGLQVRGELEQKQHVRYMDDAVVNNYVSGVADRVLQFAKQDRPGINWKVSVIDDPKTVNAFATPGGYLYVYSGLLLAADNEAEIAGVMGHESGHVVARHSARSMVDAYGLEAVSALALGNNPGLLAQIGSGIATKGTMLAHSRGDEDEADTYGARYSSAAGYDPHGLVTFFQKLKALEGSTPGVMQYLSDHPATGDRIAHVNQYIAQHNLGGTNLGQAGFAPIKARLKARPAPPANAPSGAAPGGSPPPSGAGTPPPNK